jgi:hypothetical protein
MFLMCWHSIRQIHWSSTPLILFILFECGHRSFESLLWASSALVLFECGLSCPSKRTAYILRVQVILSLEVHCSYYSSTGSGPSNRFLWASSASIFFECGLWSRESLSSGQQRLYILLVWASVPRIAFFGPAAPPYSSSADFDPSKRFLRASSASILFECGLQSLESLFSGQQRLHIIRVQASVP